MVGEGREVGDWWLGKGEQGRWWVWGWMSGMNDPLGDTPFTFHVPGFAVCSVRVRKAGSRACYELPTIF